MPKLVRLSLYGILFTLFFQPVPHTSTQIALVELGGAVSNAISFNSESYGFSGNQSATISIGQYKSPLYGTLNSQSGLAFDSSGRLWIADTYNNRVLAFAAPFSNDMPAAFVLGQKNFKSTGAGIAADGLNSPVDVAFDQSGGLWVADLGNNRVLGFEHPFQNGMNASIVIGQLAFSSREVNTTRNRLNGPYGIAFDPSGNLWVADAWNNRTLEFDPPFSSGMNASLVIGEPDFNTACVKNCATSSVLNGPWRVTFDPSGDLWVREGAADTNRLLEFKPPFKNGMEASLVIDLINPNPVYGETIGLALKFDSTGNLWMGYWGEAPQGGVFEFKPPFGDHMNASVRLAGYPGDEYSRSLSAPTGLTLDSSGNIWVVDWGTRWLVSLTARILGFDAQVHVVNAPTGRVYFENHGGLLFPLSSVPVTQVGPLTFSQGLFNFTIQGLPAGGTAAVTISYPQRLTTETAWWSMSGSEWVKLPTNETYVNGNNMTLTLRGAGPNGIISILGGPAIAPPNTTEYTVNTASNTSEHPPVAMPGYVVPSLAVIIAFALTASYWRQRRKVRNQLDV